MAELLRFRLRAKRCSANGGCAALAMTLVVPGAFAATALAGIATLWRTDVADEVAAAPVLVAAAAVEVSIDVGVCIGTGIRIDVRIGIALERLPFECLALIALRRVALIPLERLAFERPTSISLQRVALFALECLAFERPALTSLQRVALIALNVELALRPLQVTLQCAARAWEVLLLEIPRLAELLAQRCVLELNGAAVRGIELPMIAVRSNHQIGAVESIVVDDIDGDRAAAGPTAVPAPVIVRPQRRTDEEPTPKPITAAPTTYPGGYQ